MKFDMWRIITSKRNYYIIYNSYDYVVKYVKEREKDFKIEKINRKRKMLIPMNGYSEFLLLERVLGRLEEKRIIKLLFFTEKSIVNLE